MYTSFFGLNEKPFSIAPNPRYLYMSERHTEALALLIYGITESGGFIRLTGEVGTGKTTLVRRILQQLPDTTDVALILNPQLSCTEFLAAILDEFAVEQPQDRNSVRALTDALNQFLLENYSRGRRTVLIVDEAQNFAIDVLEQIRLLTNLETVKQKLLQIMLIGQPELRDMLARTDLRQLAQRITGGYHLEPLNRDETAAYISHRLKVAGATGPIFNAAARRELYRLSRGIPRVINVIADRAMLGAFTRDLHQITPALVRQAASEVYDRPAVARPRWLKWLRRSALAAAVLVIAIGLGYGWTVVRQTRAGIQAPDQAVPADSALEMTADSDDGPVATGGGETERLPLAELDHTIREHADDTGTDNAFATLFGLWGVEYASGSMRACEQAEEHNLHCLFQRGSLAQVASINRPVILTLRDTEGAAHQVVMEALGPDRVVINIAGQQFNISIDELNRSWYGEYLLLWRPQIGQVKSFIPGMRDPDVTWLRESLAAIQGEPAVSDSADHYDAELEERVRDYQKTKRLNVDGLVGQQTQIAINTDLGLEDTPTLARGD